MRFALLLLALPALARADVTVRAPFVRVEVGPVVHVRAPFVNIVVPRTVPVPMPVPPPARGGVVPSDPGEPPPVPGYDAPPVRIPAVRAVTLGDFVGRAKPFDAGRYDVVLIHPATGRPVRVAFELPVRPRSASVTRSRIDFSWGIRGRRGLSIVFLADGTVEVG